jgi:carbon-monoxide dehydrogenase large subunit
MSLIGQSVKRREDARFLTGRGQYTDDIVLPRQAYGVFVRSPFAHARLVGIDTSAAQLVQGVLRVLTAADFAAFGGLPCGWLITSVDGTPMKEPKHPILADAKVRHVGEPVALVVGHTLAAAKAGAAALEVEYEELPAVADTATALGHATAVHAEAPDNAATPGPSATHPATDAAFAQAAHITRAGFRNNRLIPNAIEPRAANASYDARPTATRSTSRTRTRTSSAC